MCMGKGGGRGKKEGGAEGKRAEKKDSLDKKMFCWKNTKILKGADLHNCRPRQMCNEIGKCAMGSIMSTPSP